MATNDLRFDSSDIRCKFPKEINAFGFIYLITNNINKKRYIGQTTQSLYRRWIKHYSDAINPNNKFKYNSGFHSAIKKYGRENFTIELLTVVSNRQKLDKFEIKFIKSYKTNSKLFGYNIASGGKTRNISNDYQDELKIKNSKKRNISDYGRKKLQENAKKAQRACTKEHYDRLAEQAKIRFTGKKRSKEVVEKYSAKRRIKVIGINRFTNEIIKFDGVGIAARTLNLDTSMISKVCKGKHKYYKDWNFKYGD